MNSTPQQLADLAAERAVRGEVQIGKAKTVYWRYAATEASQGTLVMVHGYRGNHLGLAAIAGALPQFDVIVPDLPGFGESEPIERHDIANYSEWLRAFVENLAKPDSIVLAHSFGTIVAASASAQGMTNPLVLLNPISVAGRAGIAALRQSGVDFFNWLTGNLPAPAGKALASNWLAVQAMSSTLAKTGNKELRAWIHQQHHENFSDFGDIRVATEGYVASTTESVLPYAPSIAAPVLLIAGELDEITPLANQREAASGYQDASLAVIDGVGHLIHYEKPAEAAALVAVFSRKLAAR